MNPPEPTSLEAYLLHVLPPAHVHPEVFSHLLQSVPNASQFSC